MNILHGGVVVDAPDDGGRCKLEPMDRVLRAMDTLARKWPNDYSADAVEWLVLDERRY
ncbi:hypothetical protein [Caballeronia sp. S22]|uniref:hypothetical protein n=1 Tax=Caballeronia sp. S22 TaxID=3137182 RepID=UPI003530EB9D